MPLCTQVTGSLDRLPNELLQLICVYVRHNVSHGRLENTHIALSMVNRRLNSALAPTNFELLQVVWGKSIPDCGRFIDRYGLWVKQLIVRIEMLTGDPVATAEQQDIEKLIGGVGLPNCTRIDFIFLPKDHLLQNKCRLDGKNKCESEPSFTYEDDLAFPWCLDMWNTDKTVGYTETNVRWAQDMAKIWTALVNNTTCRHLTLNNYHLRDASVLKSSEWAEFMGRLESLSMWPWGGKAILFPEAQGIQMQVCQSWGYHQDINLIKHRFYRFGENLRTIRYMVDIESTAASDYLNLPFDKLSFPQLEELFLSNVVIYPNLNKFLKQHSETLQVIDLTDCAAREPCRWSTTLSLLRTHLTKLVTFERHALTQQYLDFMINVGQLALPMHIPASRDRLRIGWSPDLETDKWEYSRLDAQASRVRDDDMVLNDEVQAEDEEQWVLLKAEMAARRENNRS